MNDRNTTENRRFGLTLGALGLAAGTLVAGSAMLAGCSSGGGTHTTARPSAGAPGDGPAKIDRPRVLWLGDSIAAGEAPPLAAALKASGARLKSLAADGGGTVVDGPGITGKIAEATWKDLTPALSSFRPNVVVYQTTTYDWGTPARQRAAYRKLARAAKKVGATLDLVPAPPIRIDDFYRGHRAQLASAPKQAAAVAKAEPGEVTFLDTTPLWGTDHAAAKAQRGPDGIHSCQQGSAAFARWLTAQLGRQLDFTPAAPASWANGSWTDDPRYGKLGCK